ncbi:MAG: hypothetical protein IJ092_11490, partial [Atopobiaceae bacterium]|nr:hypothetical protein [Atopobiaceae bacterium]
PAADIQIPEVTLKYTDTSINPDEGERNIIYTVEFDVYRDGNLIGHLAPNLQMVTATQQTKANAAVMSFPEKDLFVVYRGVNDAGAFAMDVRVNPLIGFVWVGFGLLMLGGAISAFGRRGNAPLGPPVETSPDAQADQQADAIAKGAGEEDADAREADSGAKEASAKLPGGEGAHSATNDSEAGDDASGDGPSSDAAASDDASGAPVSSATSDDGEKA